MESLGVVVVAAESFVESLDVLVVDAVILESVIDSFVVSIAHVFLSRDTILPAAVVAAFFLDTSSLDGAPTVFKPLLSES